MLFQGLTALSSVLLFSTLSHALPAPGSLEVSKGGETKRATPNIVGNLVKRADPTIGNGIDTSDPYRGGKLVAPQGSTDGGFSNALQLMSYATTLPDDSTDPIFNKYFNPGDKQTVTNVFSRLLGSDGISGAAELADIVVTTGDVPADDPAFAFLDDETTPNPTMILTDDAFVYPNRDEAEGCDAWKDGMTQDMYLLGSMLLHEYTHWDWFLTSITNGEVEDQEDGYGWEAARALDKSLAIYNADSYAWYATELLWATLCNVPGGYNAPGVERRSV